MRQTIFLILVLLQTSAIYCHIPDYISTPKNQVEEYCTLAETCVHDTIPICGVMNNQRRTFLDLCDLLEYACDTNQIYTHVEDTIGCPQKPKVEEVD